MMAARERFTSLNISRVEAVCQPRKLVMGHTKGMPITKETKDGGPYRLVRRMENRDHHLQGSCYKLYFN